MTDRTRAIIVGAPRCGTTSLWRYLGNHPDIARSTVKEANYFDDPANGIAGYDAVFVPGGKATLEASPIYFHEHARNAPALARAVPDARLIFILREPAARLAANFRGEAISPGSVAGDMDFARYAEIVAQDADPLPINPERPAHAAYIKSLARVGLYADVLDSYLAHFAPEQMLVLFLDELEAAPGAVVARTCEHIGVDPARMPAMDYAVENQGAYVRNLEFYQFLRVVNRRLEPIVNRAPWIRRVAKALHHKVNSVPVSAHQQVEERGRAIMRDWYAPANARFVQLMRAQWPHVALPAWLDQE